MGLGEGLAAWLKFGQAKNLWHQCYWKEERAFFILSTHSASIPWVLPWVLYALLHPAPEANFMKVSMIHVWWAGRVTVCLCWPQASCCSPRAVTVMALSSDFWRREEQRESVFLGMEAVGLSRSCIRYVTASTAGREKLVGFFSLMERKWSPI